MSEENPFVPIPANIPAEYHAEIVGEDQAKALYEMMKGKGGLEGVWSMEKAREFINQLRVEQFRSIQDKLGLESSLMS